MLSVLCTRGSGTKEADPISDNLITTRYAAAKRGKRFLDDPDQGGYYRTRRLTLRVPYTGLHVQPDTFVSVTDALSGYFDVIAKVVSVKITIRPDSVWTDLTAIVFLEPDDAA